MVKCYKVVESSEVVMKKYIIIISTFILVLIATSIIGYKVVSANTEVIKKQDIITYQNELEEYFKSYKYTIDNPNIIINPYKISPLTALIIFETVDEEEITITINGKDKNSTYTKTYPKSKKHYIEVLGLYPDYNNIVTITYKNIKKELNIKTNPLPEDLIPIEEENNTNELYFITTDKYTYAIDNNNEVRWYLTEKYSEKITRLDNGNLLLSTDKFLNHEQNTGLSEMNLLGKIYKEYNIETGYNGSYAIKDNNILVLSNNLLEIDRQTGKIITEYELDDNYETVSYKDNIINLTNKTKSLEINTKTKEKITKINLETIEENKTLLPLYTDNNYKLTKGLKFNTETKTTESDKNILLINYKKIDDNYKKYNIKFIKESDRLVITGNFNSNDKVYVILDKFLDKKVYDIVTNQGITSKYIINQNLEGNYSIYIKINDTIYKTNNYVTF